MDVRERNEERRGHWANVAKAAFLGLLAGAFGFCVVVAYGIGDTGAWPGTTVMVVIYVVTTALGLWWSSPIYRMLEHKRHKQS